MEGEWKSSGGLESAVQGRVMVFGVTEETGN
jgi:hypothetical protein